MALFIDVGRYKTNDKEKKFFVKIAKNYIQKRKSVLQYK